MEKGFWGDPEAFRPERFLDESGLVIKSLEERVFVFGFGKTILHLFKSCYCDSAYVHQNKPVLVLAIHIEKFEISLGKRRCPGESIAWESLFMFTIAIFESFTFSAIKGNEPSAENPLPGITIQPRPYSVRVSPNTKIL